MKALTATGSAIVLSSLPDNWEKPVVTVGALPAFAQVSPVPGMISNLTISGPLGGCDPGGGQPGDLYTASFNYNDPDGDVLADRARVRANFEFSPSGSTTTSEVTLSAANISGDGASGSVNVPICLGFGTETGVSLTVSLIDANGLESNQEMTTIPNPGTPRSGGITPRGILISE